jgi:hypothetical protein
LDERGRGREWYHITDRDRDRDRALEHERAREAVVERARERERDQRALAQMNLISGASAAGRGEGDEGGVALNLSSSSAGVRGRGVSSWLLKRLRQDDESAEGSLLQESIPHLPPPKASEQEFPLVPKNVAALSPQPQIELEDRHLVRVKETPKPLPVTFTVRLLLIFT